MKVAFVSTAIAPYTAPAREIINQDSRIDCTHFFAREIEPGRQWKIKSHPHNFVISKGLTLILGNKFLYLPWQLPVLLKQYKPNAIVTEQLGALLFFTLLYAIPARVPVLLRWEGTIHTEARFSGIRTKIRKLLATKLTGFLSYSKQSDQYLESLDLKQPKRRICYSVSDDFFYPPANNFNRNSASFLYVGQLIHRKGVEQLISAFLTLLEKAPQAELWIVGDGIDKHLLQNMIPRQIQDHIIFYGFQTAKQIANLMRSAGNFVCPTLEDHGPVVQIEAAKTGLPIIGSIFSGNADIIIQPGTNGYIVDPLDQQALTNAMYNLLMHPARENLHAASLKLAQPHSVHGEADSTVTAILNLVKKL